MRGKDLEDAERWLISQPEAGPVPTTIHREYILLSRKSETRRQRRFLFTSLASLTVVLALSVFAFIQRNNAIRNEAKAITAMETAIEASKTLVFDLGGKFKQWGLPVDKSVELMDEAFRIQDSLITSFGDQNPKINSARAGSLKIYGRILADFGETEASIKVYEETLQVLDLPQNLEAFHIASVKAETKGEISDLYRETQEVDRAFELSAEVLSELEELYKTQPAIIAIVEPLAKARYRHGLFKINLKDDPSGIKDILAAAPLFKRLFEHDRDAPVWANNYSKVYEKACSVQMNFDRFAEAKASCEKAHEISLKYLNDPSNPTFFLERKASIFQGLAEISEHEGDTKAQRQYLEKMLEAALQLHQLDPLNVYWKFDLAAQTVSYAQGPLSAQERADNYKRANELFSELAKDNPTNGSFFERKTMTALLYADSLSKVGQRADSLKLFTDACKDAEEYSEKFWNFPEQLSELWYCYQELASMQRSDMQAHKVEEVTRVHERLLEISRHRAQGNNPDFSLNYGKALIAYAELEDIGKSTLEKFEMLMLAAEWSAKAENAPKTRRSAMFYHSKALRLAASHAAQMTSVDADERQLSEQAYDVAVKAVKEFPEEYFTLDNVARAAGAMAKLEATAKKSDRASEYAKDLITYRQRAVEVADESDKTSREVSLGYAYTEAMRLAADLSLYEDAKQYADSAGALRLRLYQADPTNEGLFTNYLYAMYRSSTYSTKAGRLDESVEQIDDLIAFMQSTGAQHFAPSVYHVYHLDAVTHAAWNLELDGQFERAQPYAREAFELEKRVASYVNYGHALLYSGKFEAAVELYKACINEGLQTQNRSCKEIIELDLEEFVSKGHLTPRKSELVALLGLVLQ
ncbi:hypothetical protein [Lentibacter algarum]|uniref:hypothetical protein n=1 Tax=Lentibacter algarum TaxID=576131 RepID=UPI002090C541|nr:hypothetical protein [Lentibacter algarum]